MFIAVLLTIAKRSKQPKCSLTDQWIKKMWYITATEYYSAFNNNTHVTCYDMDKPLGYYATLK